MILCIVDTGPLWSPQAKRILWYSILHRYFMVNIEIIMVLLNYFGMVGGVEVDIHLGHRDITQFFLITNF